ncbi:unnamed protein product [Chironomus riparius]|uniref:Ionotropic receptor n=1 Tax=Chironomus riparius TaxID=315576 RepID=A0A9N9SAR3_9DIPT|nr:unnamed protein product [Chironomus riparius]
MENLNNSMTVTLINIQDPQNRIKKLEDQTILLFDDFAKFENFNYKDLLNLKYINPVRLLVYVVNGSKSAFSSIKTDLVIPPFYYFIILDTKINLYTFENRNDLTYCHESQRLIKFNEFSTKSSKWIKSPIFPKKYKNFYSCKMVIGVVDQSNILRIDFKEEISSGPIVNLLLTISDLLNFELTIVACFEPKCFDKVKKSYYVYNIISTQNLDSHALSIETKPWWKNVMLNIECSDLYTSFEKVLLPFDRETWISLLLTFASSVAVILIINRFSKNVQNLFFGSAIQSPTFNIFRAFFGIGQTRLPRESFARLILLSFVMWCLVVRTAYQGKLFEFTTTAIRKPELRTLEELRHQNFTLFLPENQNFSSFEGLLERIIDLKLKFIPLLDYSQIYLQNLTDPTFTGTVLTCDIEHEMSIYYMQRPMAKRFISTPISRSSYALGFVYPNLWNERLQDIVEGLITGGIINMFLERFTKSRWNLESGNFESDKVVLNLSHLGFGFQICIFAIYGAFLDPQNWNKKLEDQTILLFDDFATFENFNYKDLLNLKYINPVRLLVYVVNGSKSAFSSIKTDLVIPPFYFFIILDRNINLYTFENRNDLTYCHESQKLIKINEFSTKSSKWIKSPIFPKKYKNFYSCKMVISLSATSNLFRIDYKDQKPNGPIIELLSVIAKELNFTLMMLTCFDQACLDGIKEKFYLYNLLSTKNLEAHALNMDVNPCWRNVMLNIECSPQLYVPPGDLYTSFEKVLLPFDNETWISLLVTFASSVAVTSIIYRFSKYVRSLVFGSAIKTPTFNIFRAFFGIGQTQLPRESFARLIFLSFIMWCLVVRTAYQGKLFEFTTTAIRKPELRTLEELRHQNFTLYLHKNQETSMTKKFIERVLNLKPNFIPVVEYTQVYIHNITDSSFTGAVLTCDIEHEMNIFYLKKPMSKRFVSTPISKSNYALGFMYPNLWNERLQELTEGFITGGIINMFLERFTKTGWNSERKDFETDKIVLNLSHLGFGFQICFFVLYLAFLVFLLELASFWVQKCLESIKQTKENSNNSFNHFTEHCMIFMSTLLIQITNAKPDAVEETKTLNQELFNSSKSVLSWESTLDQVPTLEEESEKSSIQILDEIIKEIDKTGHDLDNTDDSES